MSEFKWNDVKSHGGLFWDSDLQEVIPYKEETRSDRSLINRFNGCEHRLALEALCRIVSELVEIEENRNKK